jgi:hypothetical protein
MSYLREQDHLDPNDPAYYAQRWLRERSKSQSSLSPGIRSDPARAPIFPSGTPVIHEPAGPARGRRRGTLFKLSALFAALVGVSAIGALFFVIMAPASRPSAAGPTPPEITRVTMTAPPQSTPMRTAPPQSEPRDEGPKSALAEFQAILASPPPGQNSVREQPEQSGQSGQLLQQFLQWRQKADPAETSR